MSFSPKPYDKNSKIAILLKIVQKSDKKNSGVYTTPQNAKTGALSYAPREYELLCMRWS